MSGEHMVNISFLYFTVKCANTVQLQGITVLLQGITVLETAYAHLLLLLGEATHIPHIPGTHAASLAADLPLKLRPEPEEIQLNQQGEWTKYESSKVKSCWGIEVRADVPYATVLLRFYHKTKIEKSANSFFFFLF